MTVAEEGETAVADKLGAVRVPLRETRRKEA